MHTTRQQLTIGITAVGAVLLFVYLIALPQERKLANLRVEIKELAADVAHRDQLGRGTLATEAKLQDRRAQLASVREKIPNEIKLGAFLEQLSESSQQADLDNLNVSPKDPYFVDGTGILPIKMTFSGSFGSLYSFLNKIESMERFVYVAEMETRRAEIDSPTLETEMTIQIYFENL